MILIIPAPIISFITMPGIVMHEVAHKFFCDLYNIKVFEVTYFRFSGETNGYVIHERTANTRATFFIGIAPLIINSIACMILTFPFAVQLILETRFLDSCHPFIDYAQLIFTWMGLSIGFHAIPSNKDMENVLANNKSFLLEFLFIPISFLTFLANIKFVGFIIRIFFTLIIIFVLPLLFFTLRCLFC